MIRKYQGAGKPNRFWNFLTNATLRSAINENPSIATSTGYEVNPDTGAVTQDPAALDKTARPELANLRNNLAVMSGTAYAAPAAPALVNAAVSNPITTGKFLTSMLGGMAVDEGVRTYTGFDGWGDLLYNKSGTRHLVEKLPEDMQQKVAPASKFLWGFANPGFYTEGITNQLYRGAKEVVPAAKQLVKEAEAVNYVGRKADANAVPKNVGWAPAQKGTWYHQSNEPITEFKFPFAENWASATHGTSPHVIYMSGSPARTGFLADRNFTNRFQVNLKKPMVQVGELNSAGKNASRNQLIDYAQSAGADGLVLDGIADNTLQNQKILLDFNPENYRHLSTSHKLTTSELAGLPKVERNQPYKPTTWLQGDDAVNMFRTYGVKEPVVENSPLMEQIRKYVPEARERYGLWGNTNITDDEIAGALYKRAFQLSGENNGAVNAYGEPIILFRGDTQRYPHFKTHNQDGGSPDNRLGTLFLGEYPMDDDGLQRYLGRYYSSASEIGKGGDTKVMNPETSKARSPLEGRIYLDDEVGQMVPLSSGIYKLKGSDMSSGVNDINAFIVRSPSVRDATTEIPVINESLFIEGGIPDSKLYNTRFYYDNGQWHDSKGDIGSNWQAAIREHFDNLLNKVEKSNQGLLVSHPSYIKRWEKWAKKDAVLPSFRDEHSDYNYYVLPDFNRHNAKHLLGYDLNYPLENSWMLYRKQGGKI